MNKKLVNQLYKKWSDPEKRPAKGAAVVDECSPCAQTEALMTYANCDVKGVKDLLDKAYLKSLHKNEGRYSQDHEVAKALGISDIHSVLLRRFNDFSSENPAIVLKHPKKVLGKNYKKVLNFWNFLDTLSSDDWYSILGKVRTYVPTYPTNRPVSPELIKEWNDRGDRVSKMVESLRVVTPDLYYEAYGCKQSPKKVETAEDELRLMRSFRGKGVGTHKAGYFSWTSAWDACISSGVSDLERSLPAAVAYATLEIQCLGISLSPKDLYFCKFFGYNPNNPFFNLARKAKGWFDKKGPSGKEVSSVYKYKEVIKKWVEPSYPNGANSDNPMFILSGGKRDTPLGDIVTFAKQVKNNGGKSFLLALPREYKTKSNTFTQDIIVSSLENLKYSLEKVGDSNIPMSAEQRGLSCWVVSW
jgi:hypothetical protein